MRIGSGGNGNATGIGTKPREKDGGGLNETRGQKGREKNQDNLDTVGHDHVFLGKALLVYYL